VAIYAEQGRGGEDDKSMAQVYNNRGVTQQSTLWGIDEEGYGRWR